MLLGSGERLHGEVSTGVAAGDVDHCSVAGDEIRTAVAVEGRVVGAVLAFGIAMRVSTAFCALVFLIGCEAVPPAAPQTEASFPNDDGGVASTIPAEPETGVTVSTVDSGQTEPADMTSIPDMSPPTNTPPRLCADQIDSGTHHTRALHADDREFFYFDPVTRPRLMAVAKDGSTEARTLTSVLGYFEGGSDWDLALDETEVYYEDGHAVWQVAKTGGIARELYRVPVPDNCTTPKILAIAVDASNVYWRELTCQGQPSVWYMPKAGGKISIGPTATRFAVDGRAIYIAYASTVSSAPFQVGAASFEVTLPEFVEVLISDVDRVLAATSDGKIYAVAFDGTVSLLGVSPYPIRGLAVRAGTVYFVDQYAIRRIDSDGVRILREPEGGAAGPDIVVDDQFAYTETVCNIARTPR